jgi:hypothetical protein
METKKESSMKGIDAFLPINTSEEQVVYEVCQCTDMEQFRSWQEVTLRFPREVPAEVRLLTIHYVLGQVPDMTVSWRSPDIITFTTSELTTPSRIMVVVLHAFDIVRALLNQPDLTLLHHTNHRGA